MSLLVNAYVREASGDIKFIDPDHPSEELAGFECYRQTLYGSRAAISLGLQLLPKLIFGDLYAEGEDLSRLRSEAELALSNLELFELESGTKSEHLRSRFQNILRAIRRAEEAGGGVVVW